MVTLSLIVNLPFLQVNLTLEAEELWTLVPKVFRPKLTLKHHIVHPNRRLNPWEVFKNSWGVERWDSVANIQKYRKPAVVCVCVCVYVCEYMHICM